MNRKYCLDANVFIQPWNNSYPIEVFPSLWPLLVGYRRNFILIKPIYDEIEPLSSSDAKKPSSEWAKKRPLRNWLTNNRFRETSVDSEVMTIAIDLEKKYETRYQSAGASANDIALISYAKRNELPVVTFEAYQTSVPKAKHKYKIPLICEREDVECITYVQLLRECNVKI